MNGKEKISNINLLGDKRQNDRKKRKYIKFIIRKNFIVNIKQLTKQDSS